MDEFELSEYEKRLLCAIAANDMNVTRAAKSVYVHRNSAVYHMDKILDRTGLDPRRFRDLVRLLGGCLPDTAQR